MPTTRSTTRIAWPEVREEGRVIHGDALKLPGILPEQSADLVYIDPPFFSGRRRQSPSHSFNDRWPKGLESYLAFLRELLEAMQPVLSPRGVIALHLDWHASHWGRVELERLFGEHAFVNEIIWAYRTGGGNRRTLGRKHDSIYVYANGPEYTFNPLKEKSRLAHRYGYRNVAIHDDGDGPYTLVGMRDVWEIPALRGNMREYVGYPTQKPLRLLEQLIACFTLPGSLVVDPCCGSGTALVAAKRQQRSWLGVDANPAAVNLALNRLSHCG